MASTLTWLDYSERERRRAQQVIELFEEKGTVDELGIGAIRDALSDMLFPGTSVLQTRARYFFFVPWLYMDLERRRVPAAEFGGRASRAERKFIAVLMAGDDTAGVIGKVAGEAVKLLPSTMYWHGLRSWGICLFPGSQRQYHRSVNRLYALATRPQRNDDDDSIFGPTARSWHPGIPQPPEDFPTEASLRLTKEEAHYLRDQVQRMAGKTLLSHLLDTARPGDSGISPWAHHQYAGFPEPIRMQLEHARNFSDVMNGCALLYNLLLARAKESEDLVTEYDAAIADWNGRIQEREEAVRRWRREGFWALLDGTSARITPSTRRFVTAWLEMAIDGDRPALRENPAAHRMIRERERALKGGLARLDNRRALDAWLGASGVRPLDYRWAVVRDIIRDVQVALAPEARASA